jgi:uncharacterized protein YigA (DUF484 family)
VTSDEHREFLRDVAESQERLAVNLEREGSVEYANRAWARAAAARERSEAAERRLQHAREATRGRVPAA